MYKRIYFDWNLSVWNFSIGIDCKLESKFKMSIDIEICSKNQFFYNLCTLHFATFSNKLDTEIIALLLTKKYKLTIQQEKFAFSLVFVLSSITCECDPKTLELVHKLQ